MKKLALAVALTCMAALPASAQPDPFAQARIGWNKPQKPFRVIEVPTGAEAVATVP